MRRTLAIACVAACMAAASAESIVYDNTTTFLNNNMPLLPEWLDESVEAGDEIYLEGAEREVTGLRVLMWYRGTQPGTVDAVVRFRLIDGQFNNPHTIVYQSPVIQDLPTLAGMNTWDFAIPNVVVPDRFAWTIQLYDRQGSQGELGPAYFDPPTVGSSDDFFWQFDGTSEWTPYSWGGEPVANFGSRVTAVPEPATLAALGGGWLAIAARRRRKRAGR